MSASRSLDRCVSANRSLDRCSCLPADDSHEISCLIFLKIKKDESTSVICYSLMVNCGKYHNTFTLIQPIVFVLHVLFAF